MSATQPSLKKPYGDKIPAYFITSTALQALLESSTEDVEVRTMLLDSLHAHQISLAEFFYDVLTLHCMHLLPGSELAPSKRTRMLERLGDDLRDRCAAFTFALMQYNPERSALLRAGRESDLGMNDILATHLLDLVFGMTDVREEQATASIDKLFNLVAWAVTQLHDGVIVAIGAHSQPLLVTQNASYLWILAPKHHLDDEPPSTVP